MKRLILLLLAATSAHAALAADADASKVARGKYLVTTSGCNDCHTPWHLGPSGPEPDMSRMLSGHPQSEVIDQPPTLPPWVMITPLAPDSGTTMLAVTE